MPATIQRQLLLKKLLDNEDPADSNNIHTTNFQFKFIGIHLFLWFYFQQTEKKEG